MEVRPAGPYRLPRRNGMDGVMRRRGGVLERLLHHEDEPVVVRVAQPAPDAVLFGARAHTRTAARYGIARMRFALGVDDDLRPFLRRFARDPLIGRSVRTRPWLRVGRRPEPFEALVWAVCEQLIEYERAAAIQRRLVMRLGRCWKMTGNAAGKGEAVAGELLEDETWASGLRDLPTAGTLGATAPAAIEACDLAGARAIALRNAAREVAGRRVDLHDPEHERGWRRLRAIGGIGAWTVEMMALRGQGRYDQLPAGDLGLLKLVGRHLSDDEGGRGPHPRAQEHEVRAFFAGYGEWAGLAAVHMQGLG